MDRPNWDVEYNSNRQVDRGTAVVYKLPKSSLVLMWKCQLWIFLASHAGHRIKQPLRPTKISINSLKPDQEIRWPKRNERDVCITALNLATFYKLSTCKKKWYSKAYQKRTKTRLIATELQQQQLIAKSKNENLNRSAYERSYPRVSHNIQGYSWWYYLFLYVQYPREGQ